MNIGLLGFGTVGRGVYELTAPREDMRVSRVLCRRELDLPDAAVTHDFADILGDDTIDTVVEAIGGLHPAREYVRAALLAGKHVVTANKAMVAEFYDELLPLAEKMGVCFRCTASVGGGIGWLSELERVRRCETVTHVGGIMNGTCNYILDAMTRLGLGYDEALSQAQALGYAEADPSTDVDGIDTWHKLIVSGNIAFGVSLDRAAIPAAGIRHISARDVAAFRQRGYVCKLVSDARYTAEGYSAFVQPTLFPVGAPEAAVPANYNLITLEGSTSGRQSFLGQGAGRYPTAYNVLQDCVDFLSGRGFYCAYGPRVPVVNTRRLRFYIRGGQDAWLREHTQQLWEQAAVTVPVPVGQMHAWLSLHPGAFLAALPDEAL
mgnify:CR=1 FL=1